MIKTLDKFELEPLLTGRLFRIPRYQRAYSWGSRQRKELFDDITAIDANEPHFMATVVGRSVGERTIGTTRYWVIEIVDGQQRLTTLIILLKAIAKCCDIQDSSEKQAAAELNNLLVRKSDGKEHHILELNHQSGLDLLPEYLRSGAIPDADVIGTLSDSNLRKAMREAEDFVNVWKQSASLLELVKRVKYSLVFLFYELEYR